MRNQELVLRDMISIIKVEPKRLQNIIDVSEERKRKIERLEERLRHVECAFFRERDEKVTELATKLSNEEQKVIQLDRKFTELNTRYTVQGREFTEMSRSLHDVTYISGERFKKIVSLEEQNKMLKHQVDLFEGERKQLVESAFYYSKELRELNTKLMQAESEKDLIEASSYQSTYEITFYKVVSVVSLLAVLALSVKIFA